MNARLQAAPLVGHLIIDEAYDQTYASDGFSRYGAYLAMRLPAIADDDPEVLTDSVRWAAFAWATATTPVMSPAYLDWRSPIEDIQVGWDDGHLAVEAVVRAHAPVNLTGWRSWDRDREGNHVEPRYGDRTALTRVTLRAKLDEVRLTSPPEDAFCRTEGVLAAKAIVRSLATVIDGLLAPALAAICELCPANAVGTPNRWLDKESPARRRARGPR